MKQTPRRINKADQTHLGGGMANDAKRAIKTRQRDQADKMREIERESGQSTEDGYSSVRDDNEPTRGY